MYIVTKLSITDLIVSVVSTHETETEAFEYIYKHLKDVKELKEDIENRLIIHDNFIEVYKYNRGIIYTGKVLIEKYFINYHEDEDDEETEQLSEIEDDQK